MPPFSIPSCSRQISEFHEQLTQPKKTPEMLDTIKDFIDHTRSIEKKYPHLFKESSMCISQGLNSLEKVISAFDKSFDGSSVSKIPSRRDILSVYTSSRKRRAEEAPDDTIRTIVNEQLLLKLANSHDIYQLRKMICYPPNLAAFKSQLLVMPQKNFDDLAEAAFSRGNFNFLEMLFNVERTVSQIVLDTAIVNIIEDSAKSTVTCSDTGLTLENGNIVNFILSNGRTLSDDLLTEYFSRAIGFGYFDLVKPVLDKKLPFSQEDLEDGVSLAATRHDCDKMLDFLLAQKITISDDVTFNAIMKVIGDDDDEAAVKILLSTGRAISQEQCAEALEIAIENDRADVVEILQDYTKPQP